MADFTYGCPFSAASIVRFSFAELRRVFAEQMRRELAQPGPHAVGVGRQVGRPERADLAVAGEPGVGLDARRWCCRRR